MYACMNDVVMLAAIVNSLINHCIVYVSMYVCMFSVFEEISCDGYGCDIREETEHVQVPRCGGGKSRSDQQRKVREILLIMNIV